MENILMHFTTREDENLPQPSSVAFGIHVNESWSE